MPRPALQTQTASSIQRRTTQSGTDTCSASTCAQSRSQPRLSRLRPAVSPSSCQNTQGPGHRSALVNAQLYKTCHDQLQSITSTHLAFEIGVAVMRSSSAQFRRTWSSWCAYEKRSVHVALASSRSARATIYHAHQASSRLLFCNVFWALSGWCTTRRFTVHSEEVQQLETARLASQCARDTAACRSSASSCDSL